MQATENDDWNLVQDQDVDIATIYSDPRLSQILSNYEEEDEAIRATLLILDLRQAKLFNEKWIQKLEKKVIPNTYSAYVLSNVKLYTTLFNIDNEAILETFIESLIAIPDLYGINTIIDFFKNTSIFKDEHAHTRFQKIMPLTHLDILVEMAKDLNDEEKQTKWQNLLEICKNEELMARLENIRDAKFRRLNTAQRRYLIDHPFVETFEHFHNFSTELDAASLSTGVSHYIKCPSQLCFSSSANYLQQGFGYAQSIGPKNNPYRHHRPGYSVRMVQEDTFAMHEFQPLLETPAKVARRLKTTCVAVDEAFMEQIQKESKDVSKNTNGATASITLYDGKEHITTATLGDSASFAVVFDKDKQVLGVLRLNSTVHKPKPGSSEETRIKKAGGNVLDGRINGLNVSRGFGDAHAKPYSIAEPHIDTYTRAEIAARLNLDPALIGHMQILSCSDGLTDCVDTDNDKNIPNLSHDPEIQDRQRQEALILNIMRDFMAKNPGESPIDAIDKVATHFCKYAEAHGFGDNTTVLIKNLQSGKGFMQACLDGHGGNRASIFAATQLYTTFHKTLGMSNSDYDALVHTLTQRIAYRNKTFGEVSAATRAGFYAASYKEMARKDAAAAAAPIEDAPRAEDTPNTGGLFL